MGNKQAKASTSESSTTKGGTPPKVTPAQETDPNAESALPSDNSPPLPANEPEKEETKGPELTSGRNRGMDIALLAELKQEKEEEVQQKETETPPVPVANDVEKNSKDELAEEHSKEEPAEEEKAEEEEPAADQAQEEKKEESDAAAVTNEASQKVEMPPLALDKIDVTPPVPEPEADDPDLMAPPVVLTDAMSSLKDTDIGQSGETSVKRLASEPSDAVMLASPITHHEVSLVEPVPVTTPIAEPLVRDSISIEDKVSAADADSLSNPDGTIKPDSSTLEPRVLGDVPEDSISLTSSAARGEDEMLMNIMGTSTAFPAATSNESVRGSIAVSEMTFDESQWETTQTVEVTPQPSIDLPDLAELLHVSFETKANGSIAVRFIYGDLAEEDIMKEEDASQIVITVVDTIFENVIQTAEAEEMRQKEEDALKTEQVPEDASTVKTQTEEVVSEKPPNEELPPPPVTETVKTERSLPQNVEEPIVTVGMEEISGAVKVRLLHEGEELTLKKYPSRASDNQSSVILKTPFADMSESQDLGGLDNVLELEAEECKTEEEKTSEKPEETTETSVQESTEPAAEAKQTPEKKPDELDKALQETLSPSESGDVKKVKKTKSRKKKSGSGEMGTRQSPGLRASLSDGTASVDSTGAPAPKPKPQAGRSAKSRGRGRGKARGK